MSNKRNGSTNENIENSSQENINSFLDHLPLFDKEAIEKVEIEDKEWLIFSAKSCSECDDDLRIYILPVDTSAIPKDIDSFSYPGKVYSYEDENLVFESRVFYGNCLDKEVFSIVWIQKELNEDEWSFYQYELLFENGEITDSQLAIDSIAFNASDKYLQFSSCKELTPINQTASP